MRRNRICARRLRGEQVVRCWRLPYRFFLAAAAVLAGVLGSVLVWRWLAGFTLSSESPALWIWLTGPALLVVAVVLAGLIPGRRAMMVSPLTIMRDS